MIIIIMVSMIIIIIISMIIIIMISMIKIVINMINILVRWSNRGGGSWNVPFVWRA